MKLRIDVYNNQKIPVDTERLQELARLIWENEGSQSAHLSVVLVDANYIRELNRNYLQRDELTDVIAFPLTEASDEIFEGEIYVCVDQVRAQAQAYGVAFEEELERVLVHGVLHFLGYEDKTPEGRREMRSRENHYLDLAPRIHGPKRMR